MCYSVSILFYSMGFDAKGPRKRMKQRNWFAGRNRSIGLWPPNREPATIQPQPKTPRMDTGGLRMMDMVGKDSTTSLLFLS